MAKKRIASILLCFVLCITSIGMNTYATNKKKVKLNKTKTVLNVGNKKQVELRNVKGKVIWKIKNSKIIRIAKKQGKYKNKVIIKAKNKGSTKIIATYKKKKYVVKVKVDSRKKGKEKITVVPKYTEQSTTVIPVTTKGQEETTSEEQTPDKELDLKEKLKLEVTNSPVKLGDDMQIDVKISSLTKGIFRTGYEFGKLEILNGDKWKSVEIKDWYAITGLGNIQKDHPFIFSIGINTEKEKSNVYIDNLGIGHYRYSHKIIGWNDEYVSAEFDIIEGDQTPDKELDLKKELKLEVTNSPIKLGDDMHMNVRISSVKGNHFITCYAFGKLEILKEDGWHSVDIKNGFEIDGLGNISENNPFEFTIGLNVERGQCYIHIDNLAAGHYRYSHLAEMGSNVYLCDEFDIVE